MLDSVRSSMRYVAFTALAAMAVWSGLPGPAGAAEPLSVAEFFRRPAFVNMVMSPDGQWIAATVTGASGRVGLLILDPRDLSKSKNVATFGDADVHAVHWIDNDRFVFNVTDIDLMYSINWSDISENWKGHGMPALIGDREKDAAQLAATSPIKLAGKLAQPLLMAYGGVDRRVPMEHGIRMREALRPNNKQVEWIDYPSEGHGWSLQANDIDFCTRVEKFLERNLKAAP